MSLFHGLKCHSSEVNIYRIKTEYFLTNKNLRRYIDFCTSDLFMARLQKDKHGPIRLERFKELVDKVCTKLRIRD